VLHLFYIAQKFLQGFATLATRTCINLVSRVHAHTFEFPVSRSRSSPHILLPRVPFGRFAGLKHRQLARQVGVIITTRRIRRTFSSSRSICSMALTEAIRRFSDNVLNRVRSQDVWSLYLFTNQKKLISVIESGAKTRGIFISKSEAKSLAPVLRRLAGRSCAYWLVCCCSKARGNLEAFFVRSKLHLKSKSRNRKILPAESTCFGD
jgi:hypothetical protein